MTRAKIAIILMSLWTQGICANTQTHEAMLTKIQTYLANIVTLKADFTQINQDSSENVGVLYLKSPLKFRFEYTIPSGYLVISNGKTVMSYDKDMDNPSYLSIDSLPIAKIFDSSHNLKKNVEIIFIEEIEKHIQVHMRLLDEKHTGRIVLGFSKTPFELQGWAIIAADGTTEVRLTNAQKNIDFSNEKHLFQINLNTF